ncbi:hypothetical protein [Falsiroseomonas ponticola]|uniref:hypothetical protein n=1 Tax=Falsiroseomonas ponticola TaxID=2786951 RepID=UPI00193176E5|nr:hypothetical protein [Roseomonas ponticola]
MSHPDFGHFPFRQLLRMLCELGVEQRATLLRFCPVGSVPVEEARAVAQAFFRAMAAELERRAQLNAAAAEEPAEPPSSGSGADLPPAPSFHICPWRACQAILFAATEAEAAPGRAAAVLPNDRLAARLLRDRGAICAPAEAVPQPVAVLYRSLSLFGRDQGEILRSPQAPARGRAWAGLARLIGAIEREVAQKTHRLDLARAGDPLAGRDAAHIHPLEDWFIDALIASIPPDDHHLPNARNNPALQRARVVGYLEEFHPLLRARGDEDATLVPPPDPEILASTTQRAEAVRRDAFGRLDAWQRAVFLHHEDESHLADLKIPDFAARFGRNEAEYDAALAAARAQFVLAIKRFNATVAPEDRISWRR